MKPPRKSAGPGNRYFALALIAAIIIIAAFIAYENFKPYKHGFTSNGIEFASNAENPRGQIAALGRENLFLVSPELKEEGSINSYMATSITLFNAVLVANGKAAVSLARVVDDDGNLLYCQTNEGSVLTNREISAEECRGWLSNGDYVKILISLPDERLAASRVIMEAGELRLMPKSPEAVPQVSIEALKQMYENSTAVVERINQVLAVLQTGG